MKGKCIVLLIAISMIATGASAVQTDWTAGGSGEFNVAGNWSAGGPSGNEAYIGTSVSGTGSATVTATGDANYLRVGADATGSLTVKAGATLTITGSIYSGTDDDEYHAMDVAVDADGSLTLEAGASINITELDASIGLGKGPVWYGGGNLSVTIGANASINTNDGWVTFGLGSDAGAGISQEITFEGGASVNAGGGDGAWFCIGGTVNVNGTIWLQSQRWRGYSADGAATIVFGANGRIESNGMQFQNGGALIDPTGLTLAPDTWKAVIVDVDGGYWTSSQEQIALTPAAIAAGWQLKLVRGAPFTNQPHSAQVLIPEPATMVLLAIGGIGALLRKRR